MLVGSACQFSTTVGISMHGHMVNCMMVSREKQLVSSCSMTPINNSIRMFI